MTPTPNEFVIPESTGGSPLIQAIGWIIGAVVLLLLARLVRWVWEQRRLRRRAGTAVATDAAPAAPSDTDELVRQRIDAAAAELARPVAPAEGIVAAWVGLEEAATATGVTRGVSETPVEFAVRVVARDESVAADVRSLLRLYEAVRYAGVAVDEDDRQLAMSLLTRIREAWR